MQALLIAYIAALQEHRVTDWMAAREAIYVALMDSRNRI